MSEQGNYNVLVEVKKTTIWLRKKDAEKPIDGRIKNQGVIMIENKIILIEDDKEIRGMINDYLSGEFEVTAFNDGMSAIQKITSYDEYALALIDLMLPDISGMEIIKIIRKVSKIPIIIITASETSEIPVFCTKTFLSLKKSLEDVKLVDRLWIEHDRARGKIELSYDATKEQYVGIKVLSNIRFTSEDLGLAEEIYNLYEQGSIGKVKENNQKCVM